MTTRPDNPVNFELDLHEAVQWHAEGTPFFDLRSIAERSIVHISKDSLYVPGAPLNELDRVVIYCASGKRSAAEVTRLREMGIQHVYSLRGGVQAWREAGHDCVYANGLGTEHIERFQRQMALPQIGAQGQERLGRARVLLIGGGGLGAPAALYLAAAGVGTLGMVDDDQVERSNLHRQVLYTEADIGKPKTRAARDRLLAINPSLHFIPFAFRLNSESMGEVFHDWDLVIDGSDNFPTRYLVNEACLRFSLPLISGAATAFEGQVTVFDPAAHSDSPCYRCLYPEPPAVDQVRDCNSVGVLGTVPGLVAMLQATEGIKYLLGTGTPLLGRLLLIDAFAAQFRQLRVSKREGCICQSFIKAPRR